MGMVTPLPVSMDHVLPHGAFVTGEVEPVKDFDASKGDRFVQKRDKNTGLPMWQVSVHDPDPLVRGTAKAMKVVLLDERQPVPPPVIDGLPFAPVEFDGITVTPYVAEGAGKPRVAYSVKARTMRAPAARPTPKGNAAQQANQS
jgi:hypothetical protein